MDLHKYEWEDGPVCSDCHETTIEADALSDKLNEDQSNVH